jgi:hypothetical protein
VTATKSSAATAIRPTTYGQATLLVKGWPGGPTGGSV